MFSLRKFFAALSITAAFTACSNKEEPSGGDAAETQSGAPSERIDTTPDAPSVPEPETETADAGFSPPREGRTSAQEETPTAAVDSVEPAPQSTAGSDATEPAELLTFFPPFYPLPLRLEGVEGRIDLRLRVSETGEVTDVTVVNATARQFSDYAVEAARHWRFAPARRAGEPVPVTVTIPVPFVSEFGSGALPPDSPLAGLTYFDGTYYTTDAAGKYVPSTRELTPLVRRQPSFSVPEGHTDPLRATLMFTVTEEGQVVEPRIVETTDAAFGEAALEAVRFWQFIPRIRNGKPQSSQVKLPIVFGAGDTSS